MPDELDRSVAKTRSSRGRCITHAGCGLNAAIAGCLSLRLINPVQHYDLRDVADALLQSFTSPELGNSGEPGNAADAIQMVSHAIRLGLKWLGNGDCSTPMGAIEAHGAAIKEAAETLASGLHDIADAIRDAGEQP